MILNIIIPRLVFREQFSVFDEIQFTTCAHAEFTVTAFMSATDSDEEILHVIVVYTYIHSGVMNYSGALGVVVRNSGCRIVSQIPARAVRYTEMEEEALVS